MLEVFVLFQELVEAVVVVSFKRTAQLGLHKPKGHTRKTKRGERREQYYGKGIVARCLVEIVEKSGHCKYDQQRRQYDLEDVKNHVGAKRGPGWQLIGQKSLDQVKVRKTVGGKHTEGKRGQKKIKHVLQAVETVRRGSCHNGNDQSRTRQYLQVVDDPEYFPFNSDSRFCHNLFFLVVELAHPLIDRVFINDPAQFVHASQENQV